MYTSRMKTSGNAGQRAPIARYLAHEGSGL
jgi:hypothetical protein